MISALGASPNEAEIESLRRRFLIYMAVLMSFGGLLWGTLCVVSGLYWPSLIPFGYVVLSIGNLTALHLLRSRERSTTLQIFISMLLPFMLQWGLGGFVASGAVMLWALIALFGVMLALGGGSGPFWLSVFLVLTCVSAALDEQLQQLASPVMLDASLEALVLNIVLVTTVTFGLTITMGRRQSLLALRLEESNSIVVALNSALSDQVDSARRSIAKQAVLEEELRTQAANLAESLAALRHAQSELILTEKLAGLGRLVAGLAHEINTPLGVSVTSASLVAEQLDALEQSELAKGPEQAELGLALEALQILQVNLERSVGLIRKLKTVSVDQSSDPTRRIQMAPYLTDLIDSLSPLARRSSLKIELQCAPDIEVTTRPGALVQILTNLVVNAATHAYPHQQGGVARISCEPEHGLVLLRFEDDGVGMTAEVADKVFEPFFTTAGGSGGSGLGMFIVHNLVRDGLKGHLTLVTAPGEGCCFEIRFADRIEERPVEPGLQLAGSQDIIEL